MRWKDAVPLFALSRQGVPEILVHGAYCLKLGDQYLGTADLKLASRSMLKPWQILATEYPLQDDKRWLLAFGRYRGEVEQKAALSGLLRDYNLDEGDLICPRSYPLDASWRSELQANGSRPQRLHHPSVANHLFYLTACAHHGFDLDSYWSAHHPLQKKLYSLVGREAGEAVQWVTDSCGMPTATMSTKALLSMWHQLALDDDANTLRLKNLWTEHVGFGFGHDSLEAELMSSCGHSLMIRQGEDGLLLIQSLPAPGELPVGFVLKIASGDNSNWLAIGTWMVLSHLVDSLPSAFLPLVDHLRSRLEEWVPSDQALMPPDGKE